MAVIDLLREHRGGDPVALQQLAEQLAAVVDDVEAQPDDPVKALELAEDQSYAAPGTWQQVRAARDYGILTFAEYDFLSAAVEAITTGDSA